MAWSPSLVCAVTSTCIFIAMVFSPVEAYTCSSCFLNNCPSTQTCETSQGCFSRKDEFNSSGNILGYFKEKGCSTSSCTALTFSATLGSGRTFGYNSQCCTSEQCNKQEIYIPQKSSVPNNIKCPACYTETDTTCDTTALACTGLETKCVQVTGTADGKLSMFAKGCATENVCNLKYLQVMGGTDLDIHCIEPISGSPTLLLATSSILGSLLMLKVLL